MKAHYIMINMKLRHPWLGLAPKLMIIGGLLCGGLVCTPQTRKAASTLWTLQRQPVHSLREPSSSPGWFRGQIFGPRGRVSPTGQPAAVWAVAAKGNDTEGSERKCRLAEGSGLTLSDDQQRLGLVAPTRLAEEWFPDMLERASQSSRIPKEILERCDLRTFEHGILVYKEVALPPGTKVWVSACRSGDEIVPCQDGRDLISASSRREAAAGVLRQNSRFGGFSFLGLLFYLLAAVFGCAALDTPKRRLAGKSGGRDVASA